MLWEFIELPPFTRRRRQLGLDEQYYVLQQELIENPKRGDLIRNACGLRKIRMGAEGRGKRGGVRVMYIDDINGGRIYMLMLFEKNEADDLTPEQKKILCRVIEEELK